MTILTVPPANHTKSTSMANRISWNIYAQEIFFESNVSLSANPEAAGTAFLLPAMNRNLDLDFSEPVCDKWLNNINKIIPLAQQWWGFHPITVNAKPTRRLSQNNNCGQFFTGGVDSFYTLLSSNNAVSTLIFVLGFDIELGDVNRLEKARNWIRRVAEAKGLLLIEVSTNLREHALFRSLDWGDHTHGSALAAVGHCLDEHLSEIRIASTDAVGRPRGSNVELDHLWSSGGMSFQYDAPNVSRLEKIRHIVSEPLVRQALRVCWENRDEELNCGRCEKCVRTQTQLWVADSSYFSDQQCFPTGRIFEKVDQLEAIPRHLFKQWNDILNACNDSDLKKSIQRLLLRSSHPSKLPGVTLTNSTGFRI